MDEVPWGGEFTDDDAPPPPYETNSEPFTWGPVATNDANVASMDVRRRHEQADYAELEQFGGSDEEKEYELIQHERALAAERAAREAEAASAAWEREAALLSANAPERTLQEARAILAEKLYEDDNLLKPETGSDWARKQAEIDAQFKSHIGVVPEDAPILSAWDGEPLRPTEADVNKQRIYEKLHRPQFRKRNGAGAYGDPDADLDLVLDVDKDKVKSALKKGAAATFTGAKVEETEKMNLKSVQAAAKFKKFGLVAKQKSAETADAPKSPGNLAASTGGYLNMLLGDDRVEAANFALAGGEREEAEVDQKRLEAAPSHLHRFMRPQVLELPDGSQVVKISGGKEHAMVLLKTSANLERILPKHVENEGRVLVMGAGEHGQLGLGDTKLQTIPMVLYTLTDYNGEGGGRVRIGGNRLAGTGSGPRRTVDVAAGVKHSVVVTEQNEVAAFGTDESGSTGQGDGGEGKMHRVPRWMYWISNETTRILSCAAGEAHTVLLSAGGTALTVGRGDVGQLGQGATRKCLTPRRIEALSGMKIVSIAAGYEHSLFITDAGMLYGCGSNEHGQLGTGNTINQRTPSRLKHADFPSGDEVVPEDLEPERKVIELQDKLLGNLKGDRARFIHESEENRVFAQPTAQQLEAALRAREDKLGNQRTLTDKELRKKMGVAALEKKTSKVTEVCGGRSHTVILTAAGKVYTCGRSNRGQTGQGDDQTRLIVTAIPSMINLSCVQIAAGDEHTVMLTTLGHVYVCGKNDTGQLGDGTLDDSFIPKTLQPIITPEDKKTKSQYMLKEMRRHPMFDVIVEQVYAASASTFAVETGGEKVYVCGSGAYGHPFERHPTDFSALLKLKLDARESKKMLVLASTVRMLRPDEQSFIDLNRQMMLYARYNDKILGHLVSVMIEEVIRKPRFIVLYASLLQKCRNTCLDCSVFAFRRIILLGIENMGVKMLQAQDETMQKRMLQKMGWAKYQQMQRDGSAKATASYFGNITDKASYADFKRFRDDCKSLQTFVKELYDVQKVLIEDDIRDLAAGLPGSTHSIGILDSELAAQKMIFFKSLARWKSPGEIAAEEAARAAGININAVRRSTMKDGAQEDTDVVKQRNVHADAPVPSYACDEAAWEFSESQGWESYKLPDEIKPIEGAGWPAYLEQKRREAKFRSPVIVPGEDVYDAATAAKENETEDERRERLRREKEVSARVGIGGKRIVESTLAASFHPHNTVMTSSRHDIENSLARRGQVGTLAKPPVASALGASANKKVGVEDLPTRQARLQKKLTSMAAAGESVKAIEEFKFYAETDPSMGYCTKQEVDSAPTEVQEARAKFKFDLAQQTKVGELPTDD